MFNGYRGLKLGYLKLNAGFEAISDRKLKSRFEDNNAGLIIKQSFIVLSSFKIKANLRTDHDD